MITIADTLTTDRVALDLVAADHHTAIQQVADLLENVPEVLDWEALCCGLRASAPCLTERGAPFAICLPHARTDAVTGMVMSVGRFMDTIPFPDCEHAIRYVFCIGVPKAMASDYLRIVGLLARILKEPGSEALLHEAQSPQEFVERLSRLEARL